jgi:hypothetical protein
MAFRGAVFGLLRQPERRTLSRDAARWLRSADTASLLTSGAAGH